MPLATLISTNAKTVDKAAEKLLSGFSDVEDAVFKEIRAILFKVNTERGKIKSDADARRFLLSLEKKIMAALDNNKFKAKVVDYLTSFDVIDNNIKLIQLEANGLSISTQLINQVKRTEVENTLDNLLGSGVSRDFVTPVRGALYRHITLGGSIQDAEELLRNLIVSKGDQTSQLQRYVGQVSRDGISQYEGAVNQKIQEVYELNALRYVGSLIADSRPQCRRWTQMEIILVEELKEEIKWALNNGTGMIKTTNEGNFFINRGGYMCRHQAIPTNKNITR